MYAEKRDTPGGYDENRGKWILVGIAVVAVAVGAWYWYTHRAAEAPAPAPAAPPVAAEPAIKNPIVAPDEIDPNLSATEQVATLVGTPRFESMFVPDDFVRRIVVTVDSLARQDVPQRMSPAKPVGGSFVTAGSGDTVVLGAANFARYTPWVELVDSLDPEAAAALYKRLYPQFQKEYEDLGNPDGYFNDRVIEVIDHLLAAPEPPATITLVRPNVFYEFADPKLESESAGRKLLLRMGPGNAAAVKAKLREIRSRIATPQ
ncbi:MAG TPA: DUF3014 domain-containing protein [Steroidobacteraceae bacterium]|nr:DUF3014 domain-containing protein [Steroidobacteraceae bacterium]